MSILLTLFHGQLVSRFGDTEWTASSPDLSPTCFFPVEIPRRKTTVEPHDSDQLKEAIELEIRSVSLAMTTAMMESMRKWVKSCINAKCKDLKNTILKKYL